MIYKQLGLMLTNKCTAACRFCGVRCKPENNGVIDFDLAKSVIDQAAELGTFKRIGLSGGEAFLFPELVCQILEYARKVGFQHRTIASNGFWGAWSEEKLEPILSRLQGCVTEISFSHDAFHAEYVPTSSVWKAAEMIQKKGIPFSYHVADVHGEMGAGPFLASQDEKVFNKGYDIYPIAALGNAETLPEDVFVREQFWKETVCYVHGIVTVSYNGDVYPCCCPGIFSTEFKLGNLHDKRLSELITNTRGMRYINTMAHPDCFVRMLSYAKDELHVELPEKAVNGCELCYKVFSTPGIMDRLEPFFEREYRDLLLSLLIGGEDGQ